jgi:3-hydroxymyristoyl/3-hydroxydecanoyl-(acyl carrier protein) dehydratase
MSVKPDPLPEVTAVLPHRPPFLFVDRVTSLSDTSLEAVRTWRAEEAFFKGHFPGNPVVPGALLLEGLAQAMAYAAILKQASQDVLLVGVDAARFRHVVRPGDTVIYRMELAEPRFGLVKSKGSVFVGEQRVLEAELTGYHPGAPGGPT